MFVLLGCEESQAVCIEFRKRGHEAYSCDLHPCSGGHPEWHLQMDVFKAIAGGMLVTQSGQLVEIKKWDLGIFFPTCTYITCSAEWAYKDPPYHQKLKPGTLYGAERREAREKALQFVADLMNCGINSICIENPIGVIGSRIFWYIGGDAGRAEWKVFPTETRGGRKPDQIIQPNYFMNDASKATCLWLTNLPKLFHAKQKDLFNDTITHVKGRIVNGKERWANQTDSGQNKLSPSDNRAELRSKTYPGIARAMAEQWG